MKIFRLATSAVWTAFFAMVFLPACSPSSENHLDVLVAIAQDDESTSSVPFREVIRASTGHEILPVRTGSDRAAAEILGAVADSMNQVLTFMNVENSPAHQEGRINEVSRHFENALLKALDDRQGFTCARPVTADGKSQASGYPDLRLLHEASGRVTYLDPKLVHFEAFDSSLRTFYFTPKTTTNKVLDDAHHLLIGIEHDGQVGEWQFTGWKIVDLHDFRVRLKAEFQGNNRDLYRDDLILRSN